MTGGMIPTIVLAIVLAPITIFLALLWWRRPQFAMTCALSLSIVSLMHGTPTFLRHAIVVALLPHAFVALQKRLRSNQVGSSRLPGVSVLAIYVGFCAVSAIWSQDPKKTILSVLAWGALLAFVLTFRNLLSVEAIRSSAFKVLAVVFVACVLVLPFSIAWAGGRARGLFDNANAAAIFALLFLGCSFWENRRLQWFIVPAATIFIILTGSRAALIGAFGVLSIVAIYRHTFKAAAGMTAATAVLLISAPKLIDTFFRPDSYAVGILRTSNTREDYWAASFKFIEQHLLLGGGFGTTPVGLGASSYLKLLIELGVVGAAFGVAVVLFYLRASMSDHVMFGITIATLLDCIFEDWLLTAGAPMLLVYLLLLLSTPQNRASRKAATPPREDSAPGVNTAVTGLRSNSVRAHAR